jgi:Zn-dependent metalloprotease
MSRRSHARPAARLRRFVPIAALLAVGCGDASTGGGPAAVVTRPVWHMETANALVGADLQVAAIDYVRSFDGELGLGLGAEDDFTVTSISESDGLRHVRLQQTHAGVPVVSSEVVVHADDTTFIGLNGTLTSNLDGFDITTTLTDADAMAVARTDLAGDAGVATSEDTARLVILPGEPDGAAIAWYLTFATEAGPAVDTGEWNYFVEAQSGALLWKFDASTTVEQGSGAGGNAKKARTWTAELDVEMDDGVYKMKTDQLETQDRRDDDDPFESADLNAFPDAQANDAHGYAEVTLKMMRYWMGRDSLDDNGFKIVSRVHDTSACSGAPLNACWKGKKMYYGDGGDPFLPFSHGLDVVAHELNHGFTSFHSDLKYADQSGGLNESFSDVAGTVAEFFDEGGSADFLIGEDIMIADEPLRWMCEPANDGWSADDAGDYSKGMDPHGSSGVPNRAFCLAVGRYEATGSGHSVIEAVREVGHIWYTANAAYWTSGTTYQQGCRGTIDAARALGHSNEVAQALADSWADVGVDCQSAQLVCDGDDHCDAGEGETCGSCPDDCGSCSESCSGWKKAKCKIGIGDCSRCDKPAGCGDGICDGDETDESCGQDCGCRALECEELAPFGCWCDDACEELGDCCADRGDVCE